MSEAASASEALDLDGLLAQVASLRSMVSSQGKVAPGVDPVRLHYIEALSRRLQSAPPAVQRVLRVKLEQALNALTRTGEPAPAVPPGRVEGSEAAVAEPVAPSAGLEFVEGGVSNRIANPGKPGRQAQPVATGSTAPLSMLGQLNQHIQTVSSHAGAMGGCGSRPGVPASSPDLKSAQRFRETWARISAEAAVDQATHRAPENAGPLNAHNLVLRMLGLMRELSPDYLRRFMGHTDSLMWLDHAYGQMKQPAGKTKVVKTGQPKK